ncbi:hypothetical protein BN2497_6855 [Janthinobacterium sp. CG23_2]|nr:hypothetical protein BN2497_6855 [Janthinobacterium sp. CG23_2]CUU29825.1 hypothetical protein BN3177_6855 [Janthinobacterium sp. CG23_2]
MCALNGSAHTIAVFQKRRLRGRFSRPQVRQRRIDIAQGLCSFVLYIIPVFISGANG